MKQKATRKLKAGKSCNKTGALPSKKSTKYTNAMKGGK